MASPPEQKLHAVEARIEQATSDILNTVDWGANMQMVDEVNSTDNTDVYVPPPTTCRNPAHCGRGSTTLGLLPRLLGLLLHLRLVARLWATLGARSRASVH